MNKKKKIKITFLSMFSFLAIGSIAYFCINNYLLKSNLNNKSIAEKYKATIEGAVNSPGEYVFDKPKTIREIIFEADVKTDADIYSLDLEAIISEDCSIFIPYKIGKVEKLKWKDLNNINQLTSKGIKKSIAQKLIDFRRQNSNPTWEQIHAIKGIGEVTLNQLKELIDLS